MLLKMDAVGNKKGGGAAFSRGAEMQLVLLGVVRDTNTQLDLPCFPRHTLEELDCTVLKGYLFDML